MLEPSSCPKLYWVLNCANSLHTTSLHFWIPLFAFFLVPYSPQLAFVMGVIYASVSRFAFSTSIFSLADPSHSMAHRTPTNSSRSSGFIEKRRETRT